MDGTSNNVSEDNGGESNSSEENSSNNVVVYPTGKSKSIVATGEIVTIDTEEFYVVKHDGNDLILLSHYNLNVGYNKKSRAIAGIQDSEVKGHVSSGNKYGNMSFSTSDYWYGKVGEGLNYPGRYCSSYTYIAGTNCAYVFDSNSKLYQYVNNYKNYLEGKGATIKSARLLRVEEAYELGCGNGGTGDCNNAPAFVKETSYWLGSAYRSGDIWIIDSDGTFAFNNYFFDSFDGVRPVIVI